MENRCSSQAMVSANIEGGVCGVPVDHADDISPFCSSLELLDTPYTCEEVSGSSSQPCNSIHTLEQQLNFHVVCIHPISKDPNNGFKLGRLSSSLCAKTTTQQATQHPQILAENERSQYQQLVIREIDRAGRRRLCCSQPARVEYLPALALPPLRAIAGRSC